MKKREKSYLELLKSKNIDNKEDRQSSSKAIQADALEKAQEAFRIFFSAKRSYIPQEHRRMLEQSKQKSIVVNDKEISVYSWGYGPRVLLVHGIDSYGGQLSRFVEPLLKLGFSVTAFDAPGHGQSEGNGAYKNDVEKVFQVLESSEGCFDSVVAHSIGCVWSLWSINHGLSIDNIVCISPPATLTFLINTFVKIMQLTDEVKEKFIYLLKESLGEDMVEKCSTINLAKSVNAPALIIHGEKDDMIPISEGGQKLHDVWTGSEFVIARGLGHNNILSDPSVIDRSINFIARHSAHTSQAG